MSYFVWKSDYYQQLDGVAVRSSLSPVVANLCMEKFEKEALEAPEKKLSA